MKPGAWERNPTSAYDGLLLACRQLKQEAAEFLFGSRITKHQPAKLAKLPTNRNAFHSMRSLCIEVDFDMDLCDYGNLVRALDRFQLSLQELRLLFFGQDRHDNFLAVNGCADRNPWYTMDSTSLLSERGQHTEKQLPLIRQLTLMRNLRVLQIENANLPILPAAFMLNKPYLQAFSARCDPRSIAHNYMKWKANPRLLSGLVTKISHRQHPPIQSLHLDANAVVIADDIALWLSQTLRHLSWRVPNISFQGLQITPQQDFYRMTQRLTLALWARAPLLDTLRICFDMPDLPQKADGCRHAFGNLVELLGFDLAKFPLLKRFELHCNSSDTFISKELVGCLPHGLNRLYLSDRTIDSDSLITQVRETYLSTAPPFVQFPRYRPSTPVFVHGFVTGGATNTEPSPESGMTRWLREVPSANAISLGARGAVNYGCWKREDVNDTSPVVYRNLGRRNDYLDVKAMVGESAVRKDEIPLNSGKLGFVTFEYDGDNSEDESAFTDQDDDFHESTRTKLFRLNGQLLDREHNLHLANEQAIGREYGIRPRTKCQKKSSEHRSSTHASETATYSARSSIYSAIYNAMDFAPKPHLVEQVLNEFNESLNVPSQEENDIRFDWYFGKEDEAIEVFEQERVATVEGQKMKPMLEEVDVAPSTRCRWLCPDFEVPSLGSFPAPVVPRDWDTNLKS